MSSPILTQSAEKVPEPLSTFPDSLEYSLPSSATASSASSPDTSVVVNDSTPASSYTPRTRTASHTSLLRKSTTASQADKMVGLKATLALPKSTGSRSASPAPSPNPSGEGQHRNGSHNHGPMHISLPKVRSKSGDGNKRSASVASTPHGPMSPPILGGTLSPAPSGNNGTSSLKQLSSLLSGRSTPHAAPTPPVASPPMPAGSVAPTPTPHAVGPNGVAISGLEASYVTKVGMALNDAVNKVFPSPATVISTAAAGYATVMSDSALVTYKGLCAPRVDRAREVGNMIANELHLAVNDQYLLRSLVRSAVLKTLSIFMSRIESLIISPSSDPTLLFVPRTVKEAENPPLSQRYSFLILRSAWELKKGLLRACASADGHQPGSEMPKFVKDTLSPWITKLDLLVNRIWGPMLAAIKEEAVQTITIQGAMETGLSTPPTIPSPAGTNLALPAVANGRSLSLSRSSTPAPAPLASTTGSSAALSVPIYLRDLSTILAATSRTFAWLSVAEVDQQNWKVAIGSSVIWKMMMLTSFRRVDDSAGIGPGSVPSRRASPPPSAMSGLTPANGVVPSGASTPVVEVASAVPRRSMSAMGIGRLRGTSAHTNSSGKRSPSPPHGASRENLIAQNAARLVVDVEIFEACVDKFVSSLALVAPTAAFDEGNPNSQACPKNKDCPICKGRFIPLEVDDSDDEDELPREAMQEAMTALSSFIVVLRFFAFESSNPVPKLLRAIAAVDELSLAPELCPNFIRALDLLPPLILLQTLVARIPSYYEFRMPNQLWNTSWKQYETTMKGFHTGEEWVAEVGWELLKEARRVGKKMAADNQADHPGMTSNKDDEEGWLDMLKFAIVELGEVDDLDDEGNASASGISLRGAQVSN